jgi:hypothetical protein
MFLAKARRYGQDRAIHGISQIEKNNVASIGAGQDATIINLHRALSGTF